MILNTPAIVLNVRLAREFDRWTTLYTRDLGRICAHFVGVLRPRGKLKAFTQPFLQAEFRLYFRTPSSPAKAIGGELITSHAGLYRDLGLLTQASAFCEWMALLTPEHQPSPAKYHLLSEGLKSLERGSFPHLKIAFALQLLELAGFGLKEHLPPALSLKKQAWQMLHTRTLEYLRKWTLPPKFCGEAWAWTWNHLGNHLQKKSEVERFETGVCEVVG